MRKQINPNDATVITEHLITDDDGWFFDGGLLVVHGYSPLKGGYHDTYCCTYPSYPDISEIKWCLQYGQKASSVFGALANSGLFARPDFKSMIKRARK